MLIESKDMAEQAEKQGLPKLIGSEKQVAWAERIRRDALISDHNVLRPDNEIQNHAQFSLAKEARKYLESQTSAAWWLENRNRVNTYVFDYLCRELKKNKGT